MTEDWTRPSLGELALTRDPRRILTRSMALGGGFAGLLLMTTLLRDD